MKQLTRMAMLTAIALTIFLVEAQIPPLLPVAGVKPGLSNIVTVYAVFALGPGEAAGILTGRVILGAVFSGQPSSLMYSAAGGALALGTMVLLRRVLAKNQRWIAGCAGGVMHNLGQLAVAIWVTRTPALISYLPVLVAAGLVAGLFTGLAAQALLRQFKRIQKQG